MDEQSPTYIYLDSTAEREQLINQIMHVRELVRTTVESIPEDQWYTARYHGWSLAATLGHLNLTDNLSLLLIRVALLGIRPQISTRRLDSFNNFSARLFHKRLIDASLTSMDRNHRRIADFIQNLPVNKFSTQVFSPSTQSFTTVERGVQEFFLFHWIEHLNIVRQAEGLESSKKSDSV